MPTWCFTMAPAELLLPTSKISLSRLYLVPCHCQDKSLSVCCTFFSVKPAVFDLVLSLAIAAYIGAVYLAIKVWCLMTIPSVLSKLHILQMITAT